MNRSLRGSSPLARGLPDDADRGDDHRRIIPARAGFTVLSAVVMVRVLDHPRSRGVYMGKRRNDRTIPGSSPLARGLPRTSRISGMPVWIIPARAGFTAEPLTAVQAAADHPRSRGVYVLPGGTRLAREGSSPLARGLLHRRGPSFHHTRIIPARAGFTGGPPGPGRLEGDHPRSRGVYSRRRPPP